MIVPNSYYILSVETALKDLNKFINYDQDCIYFRSRGQRKGHANC